jgi:hypothetical protein
MNLTVKPLDYAQLMNGKVRIAFETNNMLTAKQYEQYTKWLHEQKPLIVDIKPHRNRRSLNANAYMWVLLEKLAQALNTDKDSLYIEMLDRYGVFTHLIVKPEAAERVKAGWRTVRELGEVTINGRTGIQLQCYFGSSTYNTGEMARLIDGVVSECAEVGIETLPPAEIEALKNLWEGNK